MCRMINAVKAIAVCAAVFVSAAFADTIELRTGAPIVNAKVVEKNANDVRFYTAGKNTLYMVDKSQVSRIVYDNGAVEVFGGAPPAPPPPQPIPPPAPYAPPPQQQPAYAPQQQPEQQTVYAPQQPIEPAPLTAQTSGGVASVGYSGDNKAAASGSDRVAGPKLGVRAALSNYSLTMYIPVRGEYGEQTGIDAVEKTVSHYGVSVGMIGSIPITNTVTFKPELSFTYRVLGAYLDGQTDGDTVKAKVVVEKFSYRREFAISIPLLVQAAFTDSKKFFVEAGLEAGIPFGTTSVTIEEYSSSYAYGRKDVDRSVDDYDQRTKFDLGFVYGVGFNIAKNFTLDLRSVTYINSLSTIDNIKFSQYSLGLGVLF